MVVVFRKAYYEVIVMLFVHDGTGGLKNKLILQSSRIHVILCVAMPPPPPPPLLLSWCTTEYLTMECIGEQSFMSDIFSLCWLCATFETSYEVCYSFTIFSRDTILGFCQNYMYIAVKLQANAFHIHVEMHTPWASWYTNTEVIMWLKHRKTS